MANKKEPRVGVGVFVIRGEGEQQEVLVGKRIGSNGGGAWALPGGHLDFGESWGCCAARELQEETGLVVAEEPKIIATVNTVYQGLHYITIFTRCRVPAGAAAQRLEPDKCAGWEWVTWPHVKKPVFPPLQQLIQQGFKPLHVVEGPAVGFDSS